MSISWAARNDHFPYEIDEKKEPPFQVGGGSQKKTGKIPMDSRKKAAPIFPRKKTCWMISDIYIYIYLGPQTTSLKWMFGETTISYTKVWNHPIETTIYKWLFGVPGIYIYIP